MNLIDNLIAKHSSRVQLEVYSNYVEIIFGSFPEETTLGYVNQLVDSERFSYSQQTIFKMCMKGSLLSYTLFETNVIPIREAVEALAKIWREQGLEVTIIDRVNRTSTVGSWLMVDEIG